MKSDKDLLNFNFSHIYVEKDIINHENTKKIIEYFDNSKIIVIDNYKDIFSRTNQSFVKQKQSKSIILAKKRDNFVYQGSEMCDDFGNDNFYYTSEIMNCIYDCEYCYLQGMYTSANIVIFVNIEDTINEVRKLCKDKKIYLCISYDSDVLALESIAGFAKCWYNEALNNHNLRIELRTKSANFIKLSKLKPIDNYILAWTLSPEYIVSNYEKNTPTFENRLNSVQNAAQKGWKIRICIDPILYVNNFVKYYGEMIDEIFDKINDENILDISLGTFRISKELFKSMKHKNKESFLLAYPFVDKDGYVCYTDKNINELIDFVYYKLQQHIDKKKIFIY